MALRLDRTLFGDGCQSARLQAFGRVARRCAGRPERVPCEISIAPSLPRVKLYGAASPGCRKRTVYVCLDCARYYGAPADDLEAANRAAWDRGKRGKVAK